MKKIRFLAVILVALCMLFTNVSTALAFPPLPSSFQGTVKLDGANVPNGTQVTARINGVQYALSAYQIFDGDTVYSVNVAGDDPATGGTVEGGVDGNTIVFLIGNIQAQQTGTWYAGSSVTLNLTGVTTRTLVVSNAGTGSGTVSSSPTGIDCGSTCTYDFTYNSSVDLTAVATAGSRFMGWSGACTGKGTCSLTMSAARAVTATFDLPSFNDVPFDYSKSLGGKTYYLYEYIEALYDASMTAGTSTAPPLYSPNLILDRAMSAVFMLRANFGVGYTPPLAPWPTFAADNWSNNAYAQKWAEGMWNAKLTAGCQTNPSLLYCPDVQLPRVQAVIFALHMKYDYYDGDGNLVSYAPPAASVPAYFSDMDPAFWGTKWAEQADKDGLIPACGSADGKPTFCPDTLVDRAWAAYLIVKAKDLPLP